MGRDKLKRNLQFKPVCREFRAVGCNSNNTIHLLHEELEALYLMNIKGLYQADSAKAMGVSRPTFARIIKNAREKVTMMLISGANLKIEDEKKSCLVLIPSQSEKEIINSTPSARYLHIYEVEDKNITKKNIIKNPVVKNNLRPAQIIPSISTKKDINFFISSNIGEGLRSALLSKGIYSFIENEITLERICDIVSGNRK